MLLALQDIILTYSAHYLSNMQPFLSMIWFCSVTNLTAKTEKAVEWSQNVAKHETNQGISLDLHFKSNIPAGVSIYMSYHLQTKIIQANLFICKWKVQYPLELGGSMCMSMLCSRLKREWRYKLKCHSNQPPVKGIIWPHVGLLDGQIHIVEGWECVTW